MYYYTNKKCLNKILKNNISNSHLINICVIKILHLTKSEKILNKKWGFPLKISSENVNKSAGSYRLGHIYWRKLHFLSGVISMNCKLQKQSYPSWHKESFGKIWGVAQNSDSVTPETTVLRCSTEEMPV